MRCTQTFARCSRDRNDSNELTEEGEHGSEIFKTKWLRINQRSKDIDDNRWRREDRIIGVKKVAL